jgi:hypothetical protein
VTPDPVAETYIRYRFLDRLTTILSKEQPFQDYSSTHKQLSELFLDLCGHHYGAITVRRSFPFFRRFQEWDLKRCKSWYSEQLQQQSPGSVWEEHNARDAIENEPRIRIITQTSQGVVGQQSTTHDEQSRRQEANLPSVHDPFEDFDPLAIGEETTQKPLQWDKIVPYRLFY